MDIMVDNWEILGKLSAPVMVYIHLRTPTKVFTPNHICIYLSILSLIWIFVELRELCANKIELLGQNSGLFKVGPRCLGY